MRIGYTQRMRQEGKNKSQQGRNGKRDLGRDGEGVGIREERVIRALVTFKSY